MIVPPPLVGREAAADRLSVAVPLPVMLNEPVLPFTTRSSSASVRPSSVALSAAPRSIFLLLLVVVIDAAPLFSV